MSSNEDTDLLISRNKSTTPNSFKSGQRIAFLDVKNSAYSYSKNTLSTNTFETPKAHRLESRGGSISEAKSSYINYLIEKLASNNKQNSLKPSDEYKKLEEKHAKQIQNLNLEIEKLNKQIQKLKTQKNQHKKKDLIILDLKNDIENYKQIIENFVRKVKENIDKLCNFISINCLRPLDCDINLVLKDFNDNLDDFLPFIRHDVVFGNKFHIMGSEVLGDTGKFLSLAESQNSFGCCCEEPGLKEVIAMADFEPMFYGELGFKTGDRIQLVKKDETAWWLGKMGEKVGRIPAEFLMLD